ncbi:MAG: hypothetical protein E7601_08850 [Ruminococcaceae bacterium]|nr:hypothetical protein [Oscillospiraceae bacterium]
MCGGFFGNIYIKLTIFFKKYIDKKSEGGIIFLGPKHSTFGSKSNERKDISIMKKRILSIALAVVMVVSLIPFSLLAVGADDASMTFTADKLYKSDKFLEAEPNTFEFVVRLPEGYTGRPGVIYSNYEKKADNAVCIQIQGNATIQLYYQMKDSNPVKYIFENAPINTGEWVHVAVVRDEVAGNVRCYINGEFYQTSTVAMEEYGYLTSTQDLKGMCVGGDYRSGNTYYFKCELKEIAIYSDVRTPDEIKEDFAGIKKTNDNLLVWFQPEAGMTNEIPDLSGNGYTARTGEAPEPDAQEGMSFNVNDIYRSAKFLEAAPNTFEFTVKLPKGYTDRPGVIFSNYEGPEKTYDRAICLQLQANGTVQLYYETKGNSNVKYVFKNLDICTGDWVHIAVVRDEAAGKVRCYLNGTLAEEITTTVAPYGYLTSKDALKPMCIGGDYRSNNRYYFRCELKELVVYSDVRTADEIKADIGETNKTNDNLLAWYKLSPNQTSVEDLSGNGYDASIAKEDLDAPSWSETTTPVTDFAYSFAVVGDTQHVTESNPQNLAKIYQWLLDNQESKKIKHVLGLGDITNSNATTQWETAKKAISLLDGKLPYILIRGNHDNSANMNKYLGTPAYYEQLASTGDSGVFEDGKFDNSYTTLTVGGHKYLIMGLDFGAKDNVLEWANNVVSKYPDHKVIVLTHGYLTNTGERLDTGVKACPSSYDSTLNDADDMWDKFLSRHKNIFLVLSGHKAADDIVAVQHIGVNGNTVTEFLINPQTLDLKYKGIGGLGLVAMFYISEDGNTISVQYYSTIHDKFYGNKSQFTFESNVDKSGIDQNIEKIEKDYGDSSKYTKESYDALTDVLKDADTFRNTIVTQAEVDAYVAKLKAAIDRLVLISGGDETTGTETPPETQPIPGGAEIGDGLYIIVPVLITVLLISAYFIFAISVKAKKRAQ